MKYLFCLFLVCAATLAKPTDEIKKSPSEVLPALRDAKNEPVRNENHRVQRDDQTQAQKQVQTGPSESAEKERDATNSNVDSKASDDKSKLVLTSTNNQNNPSAQPTSTQNTDPNPAMRSAARNYPSYYPYPSTSYGSSGMGPVGSYGMYGWGPGSYGSRPGSYGMGSGMSRLVGFRADSYGSAESQGAVVAPSPSYGVVAAEEPCEYPAGQQYGSPGQYGSLLSSVIPTSLAGYIPNRGHINVVKQIIHKPFITEFQEVVHKPMVTEMQEIVNKPVVSDVEQIVHRPLYIEHIGLGPTYHGYQKHIVKKPMYQKPNKNFVHKPAIHVGTIHLADEYEHAVENPHEEEPCEYGSPETAYYGYSSDVHYGPVTTSYTPYSAPHGSGAAVPSAPASSYRSVDPYGYPSVLRSSDVRPDEQLKTAVVNVAVETPLPKAAEYIVYDKISPYDQHSNDINQRYYSNVQFPAQFSGIDQQLQQQQERSSEDPPAFRLDVNAIDKKLEKNPEIRRALIQMIAESMYIDDRTTHADKKQEIKL